MKISSTECTGYGTSAEPYKLIDGSCNEKYTDAKNDLGKSGESFFLISSFYRRLHHSLMISALQHFRKLITIRCYTLYFSTVRGCMLSSLGHISICFFSTSSTLHQYKKLSHVLSMSSILICFLKEYFVSNYLTRVFLRQLSARCHALQTVSNCFYVDDITV